LSSSKSADQKFYSRISEVLLQGGLNLCVGGSVYAAIDVRGDVGPYK
jgi:hypothetical protein